MTTPEQVPSTAAISAPKGTNQRKPTGSYRTMKVRRIARKRAPILGDLRHVESMRTGKVMWAVCGGFWLFCSTLVMAGSLPSWTTVGINAVMVGFIMWLFAHQKMLVFDRGIVLGTFLPGTRPMTLLFHSIDVATIRTSFGFPNIHGMKKLIYGHDGLNANHTHQTCAWSPWALTFVGPDPYDIRGSGNWGRAQRIAPLQREEVPLETIWTVGAVTRPRLEGALAALASAMHDAGIPGADRIQSNALPPRRMTGTEQDADFLCIPHAQRNDNLAQGAP